MNFKPKSYGLLNIPRARREKNAEAVGYNGYGRYGDDLSQRDASGRRFLLTAPPPQNPPDEIAREFALTPNANGQTYPAYIEATPSLRVQTGVGVDDSAGSTPLSLPDLTLVSQGAMREATGLPARSARAATAVIERQPLQRGMLYTNRMSVTTPDSTITDTKTVGVPVKDFPAPNATDAENIAAKSSKEFVLNIPSTPVVPDVRVGLEARFSPQSIPEYGPLQPKAGGMGLAVAGAAAGFFAAGPVGAMVGGLLGSFLGK